MSRGHHDVQHGAVLGAVKAHVASTPTPHAAVLRALTGRCARHVSLALMCWPLALRRATGGMLIDDAVPQRYAASTSPMPSGIPFTPHGAKR
jgi:hypothetical protein